MYQNLYKWGLSERFTQEAQLYDGLSLARVTEQHRQRYTVVSEDGFSSAVVSGKFIHSASCPSDYPATGDWVMVKTEGGSSIIQHVLTRKSAFERKAAGSGYDLQTVAANIDSVFICMALNADYNLRRLERYLSVAWESRATPLIVLTKSDLSDNLDAQMAEVEKTAPGTDILLCSVKDASPYAAVLPYIESGKTYAFIGSSGVGKSTLINYLAGEEIFITNETSEGGRGRHTTTHRQLILLPDGGLVMDTPGMRELGAVKADFEKAFADIEALAENCRFRDCTHSSEPGCAVIAAIESVELDASRLKNYRKLQTEAEYNSLSSKQIEEEKIKRIFGSKNEMKQMFRQLKKKRL